MTNERKFEEETLSSKTIYEGRVISLHLEEVRLPNGQTSTREIVRHPGAVAVIALTDGKMIMVDQFRKPLGKSQVEIPAGKLDPGEEPLEAAKRELEEETGYIADSMELVSAFYTSPGFADEIIYIYAAAELRKGEVKLDEDEFLEAFTVTLEEAKRLIASGRIGDAKTIMAVYAWQLYQTTGSFAL